MLLIVLLTLNPSVVVGVEIMRKKLETMKLAPFKNNVDDMCTEIEELVNKIEGAGEKCESIRRYTLTALTTGPNSKFNQFVERIQGDIESGTGVHCNFTWKQIIAASRAKYQNMDSTGAWNAVDPVNCKYLALTTKIQKLETKLAANTTNAGNGNQNNQSFKIDE